MNLSLITENLTNPALLFFVLGFVAVYLKSDLEIPANSSKFISMYLLFSIGFKGGQELSHETFSMEVITPIVLGVIISAAIPVYVFFIARRKLNVFDSGAVAAAYGSISAVTFVTAVSFVEAKGLLVKGHMVALMALMEAPAIIMGLLLISFFNRELGAVAGKRDAVKHSLTNGSVLLIIGSLIIGFLANAKQAEGIKPFTTDIFKGFLAIFLLDMGITSGRNFKHFRSYGYFPVLFAVLVPLFNGIWVALFSGLFLTDRIDRFILSILAASASYIAVPAAMKVAVPKANAGLFIPMALAITFPVNITLGMPIYYYLTSTF